MRATWTRITACRIHVVARGRRLFTVPVCTWMLVQWAGRETATVRVWSWPLRLALHAVTALAWVAGRVPLPFRLDVEVAQTEEAEPC